MCIVVYKPKEIKFPTEEVLRTCFENNPDGAGFMYPSKDGVHIHKGFMSFKEFDKAIAPFKDKQIPMVMHFRISTHAGITPEMTQPFPVTNKTRKLKALDSVARVGVAHNGIISMTSDATKISDTALFIKRYMSMLVKDGKYYKDKRIAEMINKMIGSKMAVLSKDGHVELIGKGWERGEDGMWYSNDTYLPWDWETYYKGLSKGYKDYYNYYNDYFDTDDGEAPWELSKEEREEWREYRDTCEMRSATDGASCYGCVYEEACMSV